MIKLTVFTPTYNRAHLLPRLYESLKNQSVKDFVWLIIDDGSTDHTSEIVKSWINDNELEIKYIFQENQGMSGAHNTAYRNIQTEFNTCIDSDDAIPPNGVEIILEEIKTIFDDPKVAGLIGLDATFDGKILGSSFPDNLTFATLQDINGKYGLRGDKKLVYKTAVMQSIDEYPLFPDEKLVPLSFKYLLADQHFVLKTVNRILCLVEYQHDGSTKNMLKQYRRNPRGFSFSRISRINLEPLFKDKFRHAVHLVSGVLFSGDWSTLWKTKFPLIVLLAIPGGVFLNFYIRLKTLNGV